MHDYIYINFSFGQLLLHLPADLVRQLISFAAAQSMRRVFF